MQKFALLIVPLLLMGCLSENPVCDEMKSEVESHFGEMSSAGIPLSETAKNAFIGHSCTWLLKGSTREDNKLMLLYSIEPRFENYTRLERLDWIYAVLNDDPDVPDFRYNYTDSNQVDMGNYTYRYVAGTCKTQGEERRHVCQALVLRKGSLGLRVAVWPASTEEFYSESTLLDFALRVSEHLD